MWEGQWGPPKSHQSWFRLDQTYIKFKSIPLSICLDMWPLNLIGLKCTTLFYFNPTVLFIASVKFMESVASRKILVWRWVQIDHVGPRVSPIGCLIPRGTSAQGVRIIYIAPSTCQCVLWGIWPTVSMGGSITVRHVTMTRPDMDTS